MVYVVLQYRFLPWLSKASSKISNGFWWIWAVGRRKGKLLYFLHKEVALLTNTKNPNLLCFGPKRAENFFKKLLNFHFMVVKMPEVSRNCSEIFPGVCFPPMDAIATFSPTPRSCQGGGRRYVASQNGCPKVSRKIFQIGGRDCPFVVSTIGCHPPPSPGFGKFCDSVLRPWLPLATQKEG